MSRHCLTEAYDMWRHNISVFSRFSSDYHLYEKQYRHNSNNVKPSIWPWRVWARSNRWERHILYISYVRSCQSVLVCSCMGFVLCYVSLFVNIYVQPRFSRNYIYVCSHHERLIRYTLLAYVSAVVVCSTNISLLKTDYMQIHCISQLTLFIERVSLNRLNRQPINFPGTLSPSQSIKSTI